MKKILGIILFMFWFAGLTTFAADVLPEQQIENDQAYATISINKQPQQKGSKQGIRNHFTFFTININVNGKVEYINSK